MKQPDRYPLGCSRTRPFRNERDMSRILKHLKKLATWDLVKAAAPSGGINGKRSSLTNASQNAKFSTKFPTLNKDFSEMRKFQPKPLKPRCNICLETPNPEGFWTTPKSRGDRVILVLRSRGVPLERNTTARSCPFNYGCRTEIYRYQSNSY